MPEFDTIYYKKERWLMPFFFCCLLACSQNAAEPSGEANNLYQQQRQQFYADSIYPAVQRVVQTGDLITRLGSDITSELLRQMNTQDKSFSHCGIASVEADTIFVYHAIGGEFNPNQLIKREPLYSFGAATDNKALGVYRLKALTNKKQQIADLAKKYFLQKIPFDMQFNYQTEDRFYCAEYVAKCMVRALQDSSWLLTSKTGNKTYVAVDNLFLNQLAKPLVQYKY